MKTEYSVFDAVKVTGIHRERIRDWMNRGYIKPSIQVSKGKGTRALFDIYDLMVMALFAKMIDCGIPREWAGRHFLAAYRADTLRVHPIKYYKDMIAPRYLLFFRANGEVMATEYETVKKRGELIRRGSLADDVVGINEAMLFTLIIRKAEALAE